MNESKSDAAGYIRENADALLAVARNNNLETLAHCLELASEAAAEIAEKLEAQARQRAHLTLVSSR